MLFRSNDTATTEIYTSPHTLSLHDALPIPGLARLVPVQQETTDLLQAAGSFKGRRLDAKEQFDLRYQELSDRSPAAND